MTTSPDPQHEKKEHPSTYVVQDRTNQEELLRVDEQDRMFTTAMGGVLSEQPDPARFQRVLDVGCGPGWWLTQVAKIYPTVEELVGVDVSALMVEYAQKYAEAAQVSERVHFQTGDALRMLEFPSDYFDLVNQRFGMSFLRTWDWPKILQEYLRVCKPNGVIRITEAAIARSNSAALTQLMGLTQKAMFQSGHFFADQPDGVTGHIAEQMERFGMVGVQTKQYTFEFHADPQARQAIVNDYRRAFRNMVPFLRKWTKVPDNYDAIYQQLVQDMQQPDFQSTVTIVTAWGTK